MPFVWLVECKTCLQKFAIQLRDIVPGKATEAVPRGIEVGLFECPHCHEEHRYKTDDYIPGEGKLAW